MIICGSEPGFRSIYSTFTIYTIYICSLLFYIHIHLYIQTHVDLIYVRNRSNMCLTEAVSFCSCGPHSFLSFFFLCPLLCKNGGVCLQKDRCLCPPNFTGKFCQISVTPTVPSDPAPAPPAATSSSSINEIVKPALLSSMAANQDLTQLMLEFCVTVFPFMAECDLLFVDTIFIHEQTVSLCLHTCVFVCVYVNECLEPGLCENGFCVNTRGSYSCVCRAGFILDASHGICISHSVISEEKGQCYRVLGSGLGPSSCSLPILRNITKQICCCSRVGKAWGPDCQRCPYFGSVAFKDICPAGPGYHYSASALQFNQRVSEHLGSRGAVLVTPGNQDKPGTHMFYKYSVCVFCVDVNECAQSAGVCSRGECVNTAGSYRCVCPSGYRSVSQQTGCQDIDECVQNPCRNGRCENTPGSYRCVCRHGYKLSRNTCIDVDECAEPSQCPGQMCINTMGSYRCVSCRPGYTLTNRQCTDVNECRRSDICPGQECVNTEGSYSCVSCKQGHQSVNGVCTDINECLESDFCFPRGECVNTEGSYTCVCSHGFTLSANRTACLDVDECSRPGVCVDGRCVNTEGSFQCQCQTGFVTNPEKTACLDVDECISSSGSVCGSQRCENTIGSFRCLTSCDPGYQVSASGTCVDVNECSNKTVCGEHAFCQNLIGTYVCVCDQGFTSTADGKACVVCICVCVCVCVCVSSDEDECVSLPDVCGSARCENVEGSFMCECEQPGEEYDNTARKCVNPAGPGKDQQPLRECYYNLAERGTCSLLATNTTQQECCCTVGEAWGLGCQYHTCPPLDTAEFLSLCPNGRGYVSTGPGAFSYRDVDECKRFHPEVCKNGVCVNNIPGYNCYCSSGYVYNNTLLECVDHDECEEESCIGGVCVNTVGSYYCSCPHPLVLDDTQRNCVNSSHLTVDENLSLCWQHVTADLVCQSPLLGAQLTFMDCCCLYGDGWGMECALCPATDSDDYASLCMILMSIMSITCCVSGQYEPYAGLSAAEDCGILHGCENGRCIRVAEGYTCDCYQGYELDMTSMTCIDINECDAAVSLEFPCVNARCVNTDGSFRCICRRGYVMSHRPNHCVAA
uniref:Latent-transforming growth factor beta-binding protein 4 n=1 Tax=Sphaeramia orbicularis TaxID=375764 RepID=A0A672YAX8_9TELE